MPIRLRSAKTRRPRRVCVRAGRCWASWWRRSFLFPRARHGSGLFCRASSLPGVAVSDPGDTRTRFAICSSLCSGLRRGGLPGEGRGRSGVSLCSRTQGRGANAVPQRLVRYLPELLRTAACAERCRRGHFGRLPPTLAAVDKATLAVEQTGRQAPPMLASTLALLQNVVDGPQPNYVRL